MQTKLALLGHNPTEIQLVYLSVEAPHPTDDEPIEHLTFLNRMVSALDVAERWLHPTGSVLIHYNPEAMLQAYSCPSTWNSSLSFHQLICWDPGHVKEPHPDWFHRRVECLWWMVKSNTFHFDKRNHNNYFFGGEADLFRELLISLTKEGDVVVGTYPAGYKICNKHEREYVEVEI